MSKRDPLDQARKNFWRGYVQGALIGSIVACYILFLIWKELK